MKALRLLVVFLLAITLLAFGGVSPAIAEGQGEGCTVAVGGGNVAGWHYEYTLEFPAEYWQPGLHTYEISAYNPNVGTRNYYRQFMVSTDAPLVKGQVQLRFTGLRTEAGFIPAINPAQDTVMALGWAFNVETPRKEIVNTREDSNTKFRWDGGDWVDIPAGPLHNICSTDNHGRYMRTYGPNY